ncbi:MAG: hypothetical protein QOH88_3445 [Verrucomicrobiota bacterium]|jgi:WD40 repeat protein
MKPEVTPQNRTRRYAVFLSYRHADNKEPGRQWATWLHQMLENYEIPSDLIGTTNNIGEVIPASLYPVFRDEEELPADADLTRNIRQALENSGLLVVICSPRAVQSRFVAEEIRYFKELGKADRTLALMIDGEPNAADDSAKQDAGFTAEMECLPLPLRCGVAAIDRSIDWNLRTEPIAADARPGGYPVQGWTNGAAYREQLVRDGVTKKSKLESAVQSYEQRLELAKLKVVAGALGLPLGVITQRDKAMQLARARQRARTLRRWLGAVALLAMLAVGAGILALKKQREAQEQSEQRRQLLVEAARSDQLVAEERLGHGELRSALASLARSLAYDGTTTLAAEKAIAALNTVSFETPVAFFELQNLVNSARFSPDGSRVLTASDDRTARVWDAKTGKLLVDLEGHQDAVTTAQFSPDGSRIVTGSKDKTARIWDAQNGKLLSTILEKGALHSAQFSPDGQRIVTASRDWEARVWEARSGELLATLQEHNVWLKTAQFSPDGQRIVSTSQDYAVRLWDANTGSRLAVLGHQEKVTGIGFSPDGQRIVTASQDKTARQWDVQTGKLLGTLQGHEGGVNTAQFSSDGERIVSASDDETARVWDARTGKLLMVLSGKHKSVLSAQFSSDGQRIVTVSEDKTATIWDARSGDFVADFEGFPYGVRSAQFSPDGQWIVTASYDNIAQVSQVPNRMLRIKLFGHELSLNCAHFSADGYRIVTASDDGTARVWDTKEGGLVTVLHGHQGKVNTARFSSDGQYVVTASDDNTARVWDAQTGKLVTTLLEDKISVKSAEFSPDGLRVVTSSWCEGPWFENMDTYPGIKNSVWDIQSGKLVTTLQPVQGKQAWDQVLQERPQFSPDGRRIVTASADKMGRVWDAGNGTLMISLQGHQERVNSAQFSPDGQRIVTASDDGTARVWETQTGTLLATLLGHQDAVTSAQFSPDGYRIVTASQDKTARVWETLNGHLIATLSGHQDRVNSARFSPDGQRIFTASEDATGRIWEAQTGRLIATLRQRVNTAEFSPDGQRILSACRGESEAQVWTVLPWSRDAPPPWFQDFLHYMAHQKLNSNGDLEAVSLTDWLTLRDRLRNIVRQTGTGRDTLYRQVLRHFLTE